MKRSLILVLAILTGFAVAAFSTTFQDCFAVGKYFGNDPAVIHEKINEFESKLKADPSDNYANLALGILYSALATPADKPEKDAGKKAIQYTDTFLKKEPDNSLALIYNGLGHGFIARDSKNPIVKMSEVNKSSAICDKAVKFAEGKPFEWNIRFMRANFYGNLPGFFKKGEIAEKDYQFVENEYSKNPSIEGAMPAAYFYLGEMKKSKGDLDNAVTYWKKSVSLGEKLTNASYEVRTAKKRLETFAD